jgi:hypothetical protein
MRAVSNNLDPPMAKTRVASAAANKKKNPDKNIDKMDLRDIREALRDKVCVSPRFPGVPSQYRYEIRESCVDLMKDKLTKTPSSSSDISRTSSIARASSIAPASSKADDAKVAQDASEIKQLRHVLANQYIDGEPAEERKTKLHAETLIVVFSMMVSPHFRQKYPDPEVRYNKIVSFELKVRPPPMRFRVLALVLTHLEARDMPVAPTADGIVPLPGRGAILQKKPKTPLLTYTVTEKDGHKIPHRPDVLKAIKQK